MSTITKNVVANFMNVSKAYTIKALLILWGEQDAKEQAAKACVSGRNGRGFNKHDAPLLSKIASRVDRGIELTEGQVLEVHRRLHKYQGQIARVMERNRLLGIS
jgi:hypothetical protein